MLVAIVGGGILAGYALALWWLLRREQAWTFAALAALCGLSLALRLVYTGGYPWGLVEDEPKFLGCTIQAVARGELFGESCVHIPYLFPAVFQVPLLPVFGATRWAIRSYTQVASVLATLAAFAAARQMGLRVAPSLVVGGLVAVLPWSIYYGRILLGGELILHQALLLAGLAGLVWRNGGWRHALLAAFGLCLLLYGYWAGRAMMWFPLGAAVLATGRRRLWCVAVIAIALVGWLPHLATGPLDAHVGLSLRGGGGATIAGGFNPGFAADPLATLRARALVALSTFVWPMAYESIFTMRSVAMHPPLILALAGIGLLTGVRRGLFLLGGFLAGIAPGIASASYGISAHRIMMAYLFVALAAGAALNPLPWRRVRVAAAALVVGAATLWSVTHYFSDGFWPPNARWDENAEMTALAEAVAELPPARLIYMHQLGFYASLTSPPAGATILTMENWLPGDEATTYLFTWQAQTLRAEYERLLPGRVRPIGRRSFLVALEPADRAWLRRFGWRYEARCGEMTRGAQVPFVHNTNLGPAGFHCATPSVHEWRARWNGPPTTLLLRYSGAVEVQIDATEVRGSGYEQALSLPVPTGATVRIRLTLQPGMAPSMVLYEEFPGGRRAPAWDGFTPPADGEG